MHHAPPPGSVDPGAQAPRVVIAGRAGTGRARLGAAIAGRWPVRVSGPLTVTDPPKMASCNGIDDQLLREQIIVYALGPFPRESDRRVIDTIVHDAAGTDPTTPPDPGLAPVVIPVLTMGDAHGSRQAAADLAATVGACWNQDVISVIALLAAPQLSPAVLTAIRTLAARETPIPMAAKQLITLVESVAPGTGDETVAALGVFGTRLAVGALRRDPQLDVDRLTEVLMSSSGLDSLDEPLRRAVHQAPERARRRTLAALRRDAIRDCERRDEYENLLLAPQPTAPAGAR